MQAFVVVNGSRAQVPESQDSSHYDDGDKDSDFRPPRPRFGIVKCLLPRSL